MANKRYKRQARGRGSGHARGVKVKKALLARTTTPVDRAGLVMLVFIGTSALAAPLQALKALPTSLWTEKIGAALIAMLALFQLGNSLFRSAPRHWHSKK